MKTWSHVSPREKRLLLLLGALLLLILHLFLARSLSQTFRALYAKRAHQQSEASLLQSQASNLPYLQERTVWQEAHMPPLLSPEKANEELEAQVKQAIQTSQILLHRHSFLGLEQDTWKQTVAMQIEVHGPWPAFLHFLASLQNPHAALACPELKIQAHPAEPSKIRAQMRLEKLLAPSL